MSRRRISRRGFLAAGTAGALAGFAGCLDLLREERLEFAASPPRVSGDALDRTGYELNERSETEIEREFEVGDSSRKVLARNVTTEYRRPIDMGPIGQAEGAVFSAMTSPQVDVLGRTFNPVEDMSPQALARMVQSQYVGISNLSEQSETEVTIQGQTTTQTTLKGDAAFDGSQIELFVHVSKAVEMGDDFVVTVGTYPELTPDEGENVLAMMEAVEPDE